MESTQTTSVKTEVGRRSFDSVVMAVAREARRLARPLFWTATASIGSALTFWWLGFSSYVFDSASSFVACSTALLVGLAPGAFLIWLRSALKALELLPARIQASDGDLEETPDEQDEASGDETEKGRDRKWWDGAKTRLDKVLELWANLSALKDKFLELGGPRFAISFLAHPVSTYVVGTALLATALLFLGATLSVLSSVL